MRLSAHAPRLAKVPIHRIRGTRPLRPCLIVRTAKRVAMGMPAGDVVRRGPPVVGGTALHPAPGAVDP